MHDNIKEYTLPEWAFLDAHSRLGNPIGNRTIVNHIRSAFIAEIIDRDNDNFIPAEGALAYNFKYTSPVEIERLSAILRYCAALDKNADRDLIR